MFICVVLLMHVYSHQLSNLLKKISKVPFRKILLTYGIFIENLNFKVMWLKNMIRSINLIEITNALKSNWICKSFHKPVKIKMSMKQRTWKFVLNSVSWMGCVNFTNHNIYIHCCQNTRCPAWTMCFSTNRSESLNHITKNMWWQVLDFSWFYLISVIDWQENS